MKKKLLAVIPMIMLVAMPLTMGVSTVDAAPKANSQKVVAKSGTYPTLRIGSRSSYVKNLQQSLKDVKYDISVDGIFGSKTQTVVKQFQSDHNLSPDGIVGRLTWAALDQNKVVESYYGEWIIKQVQASGVGTYSSKDVESLLGKSLTFTANKASYFGDKPSDIVKVATNPIYTKTNIPESDFVEKHRIPFDNLGLKAPITEINVSDSKVHVSTFFIKDDNTLIISGGGTYFELIRK